MFIMIKSKLLHLPNNPAEEVSPHKGLNISQKKAASGNRRKKGYVPGDKSSGSAFVSLALMKDMWLDFWDTTPRLNL